MEENREKKTEESKEGELVQRGMKQSSDLCTIDPSFTTEEKTPGHREGN